MSNARKRMQLSNEEIFKRLKLNNWQPVDTLEQIKERIIEFNKSQVKTGLTKISKVDSNYLWTQVFFKCPEMFLFNDLVAELRSRYGSDSRRMNTYRRNDVVQMNNMDDSIDRMSGISRLLYQDLLPNDPFKLAALSFSDLIKTQKPRQTPQPVQQEPQTGSAANLFDDEQTNLTENHKKPADNHKKSTDKQAKSAENQPKSTDNSRIKLTKSIKSRLANDATPIEVFFGESAEELNKMLKEKHVSTLGEFMSLMQDRNQYMNITVNAKRKYGDQYTNLIDKICDYAEKAEKTGAARQSEQNSPSPMTAAQKPATQPDLQEPDFYQQMMQRSSSDFEAGSQTMAQIARAHTQYMQGVLSSYIDNGASKDYIKKIMDDEAEKWHGLVDQKRADAEKEALRSYVTERLKKDEAYRVSPKYFVDKEIRHVDHFAGDDQDL